jgi:hypothetical protein
VRLSSSSALRQKFALVRALHDTQRVFIRTELTQISGLIPVLMKRRNGGQWSREDRAILQRDLQAVRNLSPYLIPIVMPGGILLLPLLAWWLDNRRKQRR